MSKCIYIQNIFVVRNGLKIKNNVCANKSQNSRYLHQCRKYKKTAGKIVLKIINKIKLQKTNKTRVQNRKINFYGSSN